MTTLVAVKHLQDDLFRSIPPDVRGIPPEDLWRILDQVLMKFIFFGKIADLYLQFFKNAIAHFFQRICCILPYTYFSKQIWLTASGRFLKDVSFAFTLKYLKLKNACTLELVFTKL